jgi:hypothetical protein
MDVDGDYGMDLNDAVGPVGPTDEDVMLVSSLAEATESLRRSPRLAGLPAGPGLAGGKRRRRGGADRCSKYFKYLLKGILVTAAGAIVAYGGAAAAGAGAAYTQEQITQAFASLNTYCSVGPFQASAMQTGICALVLKLQGELVVFFAAQNFSTIQAMATGGVAVVGAWSLWAALKGAVTGANAFINTAIDDFCGRFFAYPAVQDMATQTDTVGAAAEAGGNPAVAKVDESEAASSRNKARAGSAPAASPDTQRKITTFFPKKGGRKTRKGARKMGKSRRVRHRTSRTPLFLY